ncbi:MAG: outer membrane lipoprotein carrier protein LolA [Alphaproteobacteria bacterium]|nr:outer membrane lipoprotein carrier protein LolA [Alphaproteobacteria bacterium]
MKKIFAILLGVMFWSNAHAQSSENLRKIETYLNNIKSLQATFVQMASNGATAEGRLFIKKPNKIRMEYAAPVNVLIVGDGNFIVYNDTELEQVTHIDYDDIPASLILGDDIKIDGKKIKVVDFYQDSGSTSITLDYADKGDLGPITLVFSNNPMELKQWKIVDPQSVEVSVSLYDAQKDQPLDDKIFKFKEQKKASKGYKKKR